MDRKAPSDRSNEAAQPASAARLVAMRAKACLNAMLGRLGPTGAVHLSFGVAVCILALAGAISYDATMQSRQAGLWVVHTQRVLTAISEANENFAQIEAAQRGYLLSNNIHFLREREAAISRLKAAIERIELLGADDPSHKHQHGALEAAAADRIRIALESSEPRGRALPALPESVLDAAQQARQRFFELSGQMHDEEVRLLEQSQAAQKRRERRALALLASAFVAALLLLVPAYGAVLYQSRRRLNVQRQMSDLVESLPVTVWQLLAKPDGARRFIYVGRSAERERGLAPEAIRRDIHAVYESIVPEDLPRVKAAMDAAEKSLANFDERYRIRMPDGSVRWIQSSARLRREKDGAALWSGYWTDITARQRLEAALEQATDEAQRANRAKSTFLATMSHEIRTPMNSMLGLLELLSLSRLDAQQNATLGVVRESGRSLLRIIDDILDFSKVEAGRLEIDPVPASVAQLLARTCQMHSGIAQTRGLLLHHTLDARISPALLFDPLRVGQILNNFTSNALKFTDEGSVTITAELIDGDGRVERLRFTVKDTGIGVSPEAAQRLFEPFSQAMEHARPGGTGLGLAICRRLASLMGGTVEMQSELGKGTTMAFTAAFPVADPAQVRPTEFARTQRQLTHALSNRRKAPSVTDAEREGSLVLVVDDHPTNRLVLSRQLSTLGYAHEVSEDGLQALAQWRTGRFRLVLTDCNMPEMNGYDLARSIRAIETAEGRSRTPILGCTANALGSEAAQCIAAGMDDLVVKPVDLLELMDLFDLWLPLPVGDSQGTASNTDGSALTSSPDEAIDGVTLAAVAAGDKGSEREILVDFRRINDGDTTALFRAIAERNLDQVRHFSHRIRGAAKIVGALAMAGVCERMETAAHAMNLAAVEGMAPQLQFALERLNAYIDSQLLAQKSTTSPQGSPWGSVTPERNFDAMQ